LKIGGYRVLRGTYGSVGIRLARKQAKVDVIKLSLAEGIRRVSS
jgi:hypothetical protein